MQELQTQGESFSFVGHLTEELKFLNVLLLKIYILLKVLYSMLLILAEGESCKASQSRKELERVANFTISTHRKEYSIDWK